MTTTEYIFADYPNVLLTKTFRDWIRANKEKYTLVIQKSTVTHPEKVTQYRGTIHFVNVTAINDIEMNLTPTYQQERDLDRQLVVIASQFDRITSKQINYSYIRNNNELVISVDIGKIWVITFHKDVIEDLPIIAGYTEQDMPVLDKN